MADKPFWHESPDDEPPGDDDGTTPQADSPDRKWSGDAIDPDTGEWRPKQVLEEFEIGGHEFRWVEGPIAEAVIRDADGNHLGSVMVPFDPAEGEPDDAMLDDAMRTFQSLEHIRGIVSSDAIAGVVNGLFTTPAEGARPVSEIIISTVSDIFADGVKLTVVTDDDPESIERADELQAEVDRLFAEAMPDIVTAISEVENPETRLTFWQEMARDIIAHAVLNARDVAIEEYGGAGAVEALDDAAGDEFEKRVDELYNTGPFLAASYMQQWPGWMSHLGMLVQAGMKEATTRPADDPDSMAARILAKARKNLGLDDTVGGTPMPQLHGDALPQTQAGLVELTSLGAHQEVIRAAARIETWNVKTPGGNPEYQLRGRNTAGHLYIDGGAAMRLWQELQGKSVKARTRAQRDILPDVLIAVLATASARRGQLDLFGNGTSYMPIDWLMKNVGLTGKHKAADVDKLYTGLSVISDIQMTGKRTAWIGGKPVDVPFIGPMWQIMETVPKLGTLEEYERFLQDGPAVPVERTYSTPIPPLDIAGVSLAIGAGLIATVDENPQFAQVVARLMEYPPVHGRYKRWLGFVLSWAFRDRKKQQSWNQAFTVRKLLDDAGLPVDDKPINPQRPFDLFQEALETLQADGVIGKYHYPDEPRAVFTRGGRGWYPRWLDSKIIILPPADVHTAYLESNRKALARSKKRAQKRDG